jgi:hypothetical protein
MRPEMMTFREVAFHARYKGRDASRSARNAWKAAGFGMVRRGHAWLVKSSDFDLFIAGRVPKKKAAATAIDSGQERSL